LTLSTVTQENYENNSSSAVMSIEPPQDLSTSL